MKISPVSFTRRGATLDWLVRFAYGLRQNFQVSGPDWIREGPNVAGPDRPTPVTAVRFDIYAKSAEPATEAQMRLMMRSLLAERWKLAVHRETREAQAFVLTAGKGPLKLLKSESQEPGRLQSKGPGLTCLHTSTEELASRIEDWVPELVFDETGLAGRYDFAVDFLKYSTITPGVPMDQQDFASGFAAAGGDHSDRSRGEAAP